MQRYGTAVDEVRSAGGATFYSCLDDDLARVVGSQIVYDTTVFAQSLMCACRSRRRAKVLEVRGGVLQAVGIVCLVPGLLKDCFVSPQETLRTSHECLCNPPQTPPHTFDTYGNYVEITYNECGNCVATIWKLCTHS